MTRASILLQRDESIDRGTGEEKGGGGWACKIVRRQNFGSTIICFFFFHFLLLGRKFNDAQLTDFRNYCR